MPLAMGSLNAVREESFERALRGDRAARETLIREWEPRLLAAALRLLSYRRHDAEEAVQETWLQVFDSLGDLRDPARWPAWVYRILRHTCLKRRECDRRRREVATVEVAAPDAADEPADLRPLALAIQSMPEAYREAVILRYLQKLEYAEIAEALGVAVGTAKSNVHRGLLWLEKNMKESDRE